MQGLLSFLELGASDFALSSVFLPKDLQAPPQRAKMEAVPRNVLVDETVGLCPESRSPSV